MRMELWLITDLAEGRFFYGTTDRIERCDSGLFQE